VVAVVSRADGRRGYVAHGSLLQVAARSAVLARRIRRARVDGVLAMGTDLYELNRVVPSGVPVATFDDGTIAAIARHPDSALRGADFPDGEVTRWQQRQERACRRATVCCVSTSWAAESVIDDYGVDPDRVAVVGMGHRPRAVEVARRDWSVPRLLFVGVDWRRKNGDAVVTAFRHVRERYPDATLDVVGGHPRLDLPGVQGHGLLRRDVAAEQASLDRLYERATMFVLPSRFDPSPIAYLEAASAALPVVATTEGGAAELLDGTAVVVHPADQVALAHAIEHLCAPGVARVTGLRSAAIASRSTWDRVAARILARLAGPSHGDDQAVSGIRCR
jgi:glycosyltransferase involved in cell wall biosynthesis